MFLDYLKNFVIKKIVNKSLSVDIVHDNIGKIVTVGIVADEAFAKEIQSMKQSLTSKGILENNISTIFRSSNIQANTADKITFNSTTVSKTGKFLDPAILKFIDKDFDLLINYYGQEKPVSIMASVLSRAKFKVGFATIDKRVNNLIIDTSPHDYPIFDEELFKYLKLLNRI